MATQSVGCAGRTFWHIDCEAIYGVGSNGNGQVGQGNTVGRLVDWRHITGSGDSSVNVVSVQAGHGMYGDSYATMFEVSGSNGYSLYGLGYAGNSVFKDNAGGQSWSRPEFVIGNGANSFDDYAFNSNKALFVKSGDLYAKGSTSYGALGTGLANQGSVVTQPTLMKEGGVTKCAVSDFNTYYIQSGDLYGMGPNWYANLGFEQNFMTNYDSYKIAEGGVTEVDAAGGSVAFIQSGKLYACGRNDDGQFGMGDSWNQYDPFDDDFSPIYITGENENNKRVISVSLSSHNMFLIIGDGANGGEGTLYGAGRNDYGTVGIGVSGSQVLYLAEVTGSRVMAVDTFSRGSICYIAGSGVFVWGDIYREFSALTSSSPVTSPWHSEEIDPMCVGDPHIYPLFGKPYDL